MSEQSPDVVRIEIEGPDGIRLKQLQLQDAPTYFDLVDFDRKHLSQFDDDTARKYPDIRSVVESILHPQDPEKLRFGIWNGSTMVGSINLIPQENDEAEIGYWVGKEHTGHGYATKSVKALSKYAFEVLGKSRLTANVFWGNDASRRTLEKAGYKLPEPSIYSDTRWHLELDNPTTTTKNT